MSLGIWPLTLNIYDISTHLKLPLKLVLCQYLWLLLCYWFGAAFVLCGSDVISLFWQDYFAEIKKKYLTHFMPLVSMPPEHIRKPEVQWHEMGEEVTKVLKNLTKIPSKSYRFKPTKYFTYHLFSIKRFLKVTFLEIPLPTLARKQE